MRDLRMVRWSFFLYVAIHFAFWCQAANAQDCGKERWPVKTLSDPDGAAVAGSTPVDATIEELVAKKAPTRSELLKADAERFPDELHLYKVHVTVIGAKRETDSDIHVVIKSKTSSAHMIVEIPNGACVLPEYKDLFNSLQASFDKQVVKTAKKFKKLKKSQQKNLEITGPFFFDMIHGQTGVAKNGAELHPVIQFSVE